jgi:hypothetical protein
VCSSSRRFRKIENLLRHVGCETIVCLEGTPQEQRAWSTDRAKRETCCAADTPCRITKAVGEQ